jgi:hypothetical protein
MIGWPAAVSEPRSSRATKLYPVLRPGLNQQVKPGSHRLINIYLLCR